MRQKTLQAPLVHLNGTAKDDLLDAIQVAHRVIGDATVKLRLTAPNGRDYYPLGPVAMQSAEDQHRARMRKLAEVQFELAMIAIAICEGETTVDLSDGL